MNTLAQSVPCFVGFGLCFCCVGLWTGSNYSRTPSWLLPKPQGIKYGVSHGTDLSYPPARTRLCLSGCPNHLCVWWDSFTSLFFYIGDNVGFKYGVGVSLLYCLHCIARLIFLHFCSLFLFVEFVFVFIVSHDDLNLPYYRKPTFDELVSNDDIFESCWNLNKWFLLSLIKLPSIELLTKYSWI